MLPVALVSIAWRLISSFRTVAAKFQTFWQWQLDSLNASKKNALCLDIKCWKITQRTQAQHKLFDNFNVCLQLFWNTPLLKKKTGTKLWAMIWKPCTNWSPQLGRCRPLGLQDMWYWELLTVKNATSYKFCMPDSIWQELHKTALGRSWKHK